jgi:phenylacetate-CoA ligase
VAFEYEDAGGGLVSPLVTSFRRDTQIMARYRMNDLLRLSVEPCSCGSPLQAVDEIVGRMDDIFVFKDVLITPDVLRNVVLDADRSITDFRLIQSDAAQIHLNLPPDVSRDAAARAKQAVEALLLGFGAQASVDVKRIDLPMDPTRKLRRVQRLAVVDA